MASHYTAEEAIRLVCCEDDSMQEIFMDGSDDDLEMGEDELEFGVDSVAEPSGSEDSDASQCDYSASEMEC